VNHLIIELALSLLAATLIGWLLGRFLCKSGEYEERAEKRRLAAELSTVRDELNGSQEAADGLRRQLREQAEAAASIAQDRSALRIQLKAMEAELEQRLCRVQELETCNARRSALEAELQDRDEQLLELRSTCTAQADRIGVLTEQKTALEARVGRLTEQQRHCLERLEALALSVDQPHGNVPRRVRRRRSSSK
jgi:chromosome segregation ATPase